jgi:hypothetical protein
MGAEFSKIGGRVAGADLSSYQYYYVMLDNAGVVQVANAQTAGLGILMNKPASGEACEIAGPGEIVPVHGGATGAAGDVAMVETGDPGKLIKATDGLVVVGLFLQAVADGTRSDMLIYPPHICSDVSVEGIANA